MTPHEARVRALVSQGQITEAEGARLVSVLRADASGWSILFNPFDRLSTSALWAIAAAAIIAGLGLSRVGFRFDGALDVHRVMAAPRWGIAIFDHVNAVVLTAVIAWLTSLVVARRGRLVDFVMTIGAARLPLIFVALVTHALMPSAAEVRAIVSGAPPGPGQVSALVLATASTLPLFLWSLALLYRAFAVSSGLKGARAGFSFGVMIVVAEVASKVALVLIR